MHTSYAGLAKARLYSLEKMRQRCFAVQPYLRLGECPERYLELVWFSALNVRWCVQIKTQSGERWNILKTVRMSGKLSCPQGKANCFVTQLPRHSDEQIEYRIFVASELVFQGQYKAKDCLAHSSRVVAFGDFGDGDIASYRTAEAVIDVKPDLLVLLGDLVYEHGRVREYLKYFFPVLASLLCTVVSAPVSGNHDIGPLFKKNITPKREFHDLFAFYQIWRNPSNGPVLSRGSRRRLLVSRKGWLLSNRFGKHFAALTNYSFNWANSHWVVLDANEFMDWRGMPELRKWLEDDLRQSQAQFNIVCWHQPALCSDRKYGSDRRMLAVQDILQENNVVLVLSGHSHVYECSYAVRLERGELMIANPELYDGKENTELPEGYLIHLVSGAPAKLPAEGSEPEWTQPTTRILVYDRNSFTQLDFSLGRLEVRQISSADGQVLDYFVITKA